ncbi:suppressor of lurcher protein 1 isoform X2 [Drosophila gunungcola]|uniref:suppressor of lurcher protein 1 isoform X2 n=1 Tax=Drosophila gunungcola TaxID=103775 RepID=UPI0022E215A2|nr:suppressor of lurcher protein 1 isoform X2 [Drosophila gunungcola]
MVAKLVCSFDSRHLPWSWSGIRGGNGCGQLTEPEPEWLPCKWLRFLVLTQSIANSCAVQMAGFSLSFIKCCLWFFFIHQSSAPCAPLPTKQCKQTFDSRVNKSGTFDSNQLLLAKHALGGVLIGGSRVLQCRYEFEAQPPERIQIRFHDFNVPTEHENSTACQPGDALHVVTEVRGRYETQELLCGAFLPKPLMSNGARLQLQFVGKYPPAMTNKVQYYGFRAEYRFLTNFGIMSGVQQEDCSFVYNSSERISGLFHSPNFPGYYLENVVCNYYFYGASDERVVLHFTYFDVEGIGSCDHQTASDFIEFSNFMSTDRKFSRYCGRLPDFEMRSDGRFFRVTLHSNDRFVAIGFRALYTFEAIPVNNSIADLRDNASMQSFVSSALSLPATNLYKLIFYIMFMYI